MARRNPIDRVPSLVRDLYSVVRRLEELFEGRHFTPDGHLVGSIGEVVAAHRYGLTLLPASAKCHDAKTSSGKLVQIKATQGRSVALRSRPRHLIVLKLLPNGKSEEVYNGPGHRVWNRAGKMQKNGQRPVSVARLLKLMENMPESKRVAHRVKSGRGRGR